MSTKFKECLYIFTYICSFYLFYSPVYSPVDPPVVLDEPADTNMIELLAPHDKMLIRTS